TLLGTCDTPGSTLGIFVSGHVAYVADGDNGLQCIDITNPASPTLLGTRDTSGLAQDVFVIGDVAYVADGDNGLQYINTTNPASPALLYTYDTASFSRSVFVSGSVAYVADETQLLGIKIAVHPWEDTTPPTNPTSPCLQTVGSTTSGIWQNTVADPAFSWSGASDGYGTGVVGYYVYWGIDSAGTSPSFQAGTTYDPGPVTSETIHFLRVRAIDDAGNNASSWVTLYEFRYDNTAPSNPTNCIQTVGSTTNGTWQSMVNNPSFSWGGASDGMGSGVAGYYVYWGPNSTGSSSSFQAATTYDLTPVTDGIYYLRVRTRDAAGNNASSWVTLYEFRYDNTAPSNPTNCIQTVGSTTSGKWQNTVADPAFSWSGASDGMGSGVAGYYVYWGTDSMGTSTMFQVATTFDPNAVAKGTTYYLRVMAQDAMGFNASSWVTLYVFMYGDAPAEAPGVPGFPVALLCVIILATTSLAGYAFYYKMTVKYKSSLKSK
ncbi:MAG: hypothetical protein Q6370_022895, partial [Candidatus Sigynarchaeota archaeon]